MKISVVVNTYNEEPNIERCLKSVKSFADEIVVVDMYSADKTVEITKRYTDIIFYHDYTRYVEPARNFALSKATGDWVLIIDADEELADSLAVKLKNIAQNKEVDYVEIPRRNIIFGKWIENSRWWPDYNIRFFQRGKVSYSDKIHCPPGVEGEGLKLEATEELALNHYHYTSISQFVERLNRYSGIQAENLVGEGYQFKWQDLLTKPTDEFLSRYYSGEGYKDGLHGLALALLQAFSEMITYLKVWESQKFKQVVISGVDEVLTKQTNNLLYWRINRTVSPITKLLLKIKKKL